MTAPRSALLGPMLGLLLLGAHAARAGDAPATDDLLARAGAARAEQVEAVAALLARDEPRARAWGASLAAEHGIREAIPRLLDLAEAGEGAVRTPGAVALLAVYDALVRLDAKVEGRPFLARVASGGSTLFEAAALALLVRGDDVAGRLDAFDTLDAGDRSNEEAWLALGNVLAKAQTPGLAARLLDRIPLPFDVTVRSDDAISGRGGGWGSACGDGRLTIPSGFPPLFLYGLTRRPEAGDVLLAPGRKPVHLRRRRMTGGFGSVRSTHPGRADDRLGWIADLLGTEPERLSVRTRAGVTVRWSDADAYLAEVGTARQAVLDGWWSLVRRLVDAGHLPEGDGRLRVPRLETSVRDDRTDRSLPLPPLPAPSLSCPW